MLMYGKLVGRGGLIREQAETGARWSERGSGVVEWLGISALSIGVLVVLFSALEAVGLDLIAAIRSQLGV